jgi:type IV pilus assembly protein PilP
MLMLQTSLLLLLAGCGEVVTSEKEGTATPQAPPKAKKEKEEEEVVDAYVYNPAGKRDPFQSFLGPVDDDDRDLTNKDFPPIQRWDVERYVLRGVIFNADSPRALLIDPEGVGHVVRLGSYVGRNWGKVSSIADKLVMVTEEYRTPEDDLVVNTVELRLGVGSEK